MSDDFRDKLSSDRLYQPQRRFCHEISPFTRHESCAPLFKSLNEHISLKKQTFQSFLGEMDHEKQVKSKFHMLEPIIGMQNARNTFSQTCNKTIENQLFSFQGAHELTNALKEVAHAQKKISDIIPKIKSLREQIETKLIDDKTTFSPLVKKIFEHQCRHSIASDSDQQSTFNKIDHSIKNQEEIDQATNQEFSELEKFESEISPLVKCSSSHFQQEVSAYQNHLLSQSCDEQQNVESILKEAKCLPKTLYSQPQKQAESMKQQINFNFEKIEEKPEVILQHQKPRIKKSLEKATKNEQKAGLPDKKDLKHTGFQCKHCEKIFSTVQALGGHCSHAHKNIQVGNSGKRIEQEIHGPECEARNQAMLQVLNIMKEKGELTGFLKTYLEVVESGKKVKKPNMETFPLKYQQLIETIIRLSF